MDEVSSASESKEESSSRTTTTTTTTTKWIMMTVSVWSRTSARLCWARTTSPCPHVVRSIFHLTIRI
eukprot:scaffold39548_cov168-Amphora_coffeaeformis.AAC.2